MSQRIRPAVATLHRGNVRSSSSSVPKRRLVIEKKKYFEVKLGGKVAWTSSPNQGFVDVLSVSENAKQSLCYVLTSLLQLGRATWTEAGRELHGRETGSVT